MFGWMVPPKVSLLKLTQGETIKNMYEKYQVIQDMLVPLKNLGKSLDFFDKELDVSKGCIFCCLLLVSLDKNENIFQQKKKNSEMFLIVFNINFQK